MNKFLAAGEEAARAPSGAVVRKTKFLHPLYFTSLNSETEFFIKIQNNRKLQINPIDKMIRNMMIQNISYMKL